jgi:hypothetical protein
MEMPVNFAIHGTRPRRWWPPRWPRRWRPPSWLLIAVLASLLTWVGWAVVLMIAVRIAS